MTVRTGPCSSWITAQDVVESPLVAQAIANVQKRSNPFSDDAINAICASSAESATEILFQLTAQKFTGSCGPVTIRPVARPLRADGISLGLWSYGGFGSSGSFMPFGTPAVVSAYGRNDPPVIELFDYPVNEIIEVKINGVVITPDQYELRGHKHLVRMRPTANAQPEQRWGWPTTQIQDLPDTEQGTFSITYMHGLDPGYAGRLACVALAEFLALPKFGDPSQMPERTTTITRQGVTVQVVSPIDMIAKGQTGVTVTDLWILAENPTKQRRRSLVFSPDRPPQRRTARPSS